MIGYSALIKSGAHRPAPGFLKLILCESSVCVCMCVIIIIIVITV